LIDAGLDSFVGPLTQPGFVIIEEGSGVHNLDFIEQKFHKPARKGVVVYPCLYSDFRSMKSAGEAYVEALAHQGIYSDLLVYNDLIYTVFVFVPEDQKKAKIKADIV
jgi:hypothetical protein